MTLHPPVVHPGSLVVVKALSLKQPWASLVVAGVKTLETRMWATSHRGALVVCASRAVDPRGPWGHPALQGRRDLPLGVALGVVEVVGCRAMMPGDEAAALCAWEPGRKVFELARPWAFAQPHHARGMLNVFALELPSSLFDGAAA